MTSSGYGMIEKRRKGLARRPNSNLFSIRPWSSDHELAAIAIAMTRSGAENGVKFAAGRDQAGRMKRGMAKRHDDVQASIRRNAPWARIVGTDREHDREAFPLR